MKHPARTKKPAARATSGASVKASGGSRGSKAPGSGTISRIAGESTAYQILSGMSGGCPTRPFNAQAAMKYFQHWAYAAMTLNANAVGNVPLRLYARRPNREETKKFDRRYKSFSDFSAQQKNYLMGRGDYQPSRSVQRKVAEFAGDLVEILDPHPALRVLDRPNEQTNGYELTVLQILDLQIAGDSYLLPTSFNEIDLPTEAVRLPPQLVEINPGQRKFIDNYEFGGVTKIYFGAEEIIHFKMPNPDDVYHGRPWLRAAWDAVTLHDVKRQMDIAVFHNMARPDYLVNIKSGGNPKSIEEFKRDIKKGHQGPRKAGGFLTVTGDIGVTPLNWQYQEVGTATRVIEEISAVSGVPVAMLLSNDPTKASSTTARIGWYRNTVRPYCRLHEEKLNQKWVPLFEDAEDVFLCYDSVSFEDAEALSKRLVGEVAGGVRQVNEARIELGLKALPDYDIIYPPSGLTGGGAALVGNGAVGQNQPGEDTGKDD